MTEGRPERRSAAEILFEMEDDVCRAFGFAEALADVASNMRTNRDTIDLLAHETFEAMKRVKAQWTAAFEASR